MITKTTICVKPQKLDFNKILPLSRFASLCCSHNMNQPLDWQNSQRFIFRKAFDRVLPLPVETLFRLQSKDYSQIPAPLWTKEADDGKLGLGLFLLQKKGEWKLLESNRLGGPLFIMIYLGVYIKYRRDWSKETGTNRGKFRISLKVSNHTHI